MGLVSASDRTSARSVKSRNVVLALSCLPCALLTVQALSSESDAQLPSQVRSFCVPATCWPPVLRITQICALWPGLPTVAEVTCNATPCADVATTRLTQP